MQKAPPLALLFGILAVATSLVLVFDMSKTVDYTFAVFWLVTGLLGFYAFFRGQR